MFRTFLNENTIQDENNSLAISRPKYPFLEAISDEIVPPALELNPVTVNYVNRSLEGQYGLSFHGYITVGGKPPIIKLPLNALAEKKVKLKEQHGVVFYIGSSRDHTPYYVSNALLKEVESSPSYSEKIKQVVKELQGQHFPTTENFLQEVIFKIVGQQQIEISDKK